MADLNSTIVRGNLRVTSDIYATGDIKIGTNSVLTQYSGNSFADGGVSAITDQTEFLTSYTSDNGFSENTQATRGRIYKRDAINIYNYVRNKLYQSDELVDEPYGFISLHDFRPNGTDDGFIYVTIAEYEQTGTTMDDFSVIIHVEDTSGYFPSADSTFTINAYYSSSDEYLDINVLSGGVRLQCLTAKYISGSSKSLVRIYLRVPTITISDITIVPMLSLKLSGHVIFGSGGLNIIELVDPDDLSSASLFISYADPAGGFGDDVYRYAVLGNMVYDGDSAILNTNGGIFASGTIATTGSFTLRASGSKIKLTSEGTYAIEKPTSTTFTTGTLPNTSCVAITAANTSGDKGTLLVGDDYCIIANSGDSKLLRIFDEDVATNFTTTTVGTALCFMVESGGKATAVSFYATSDRRLKENIIVSDLDCLGLINKLHLKEFNFKDQQDDKDKNKFFGLIAQDLLRYLPERYKVKMVNGYGEKNSKYYINEGKVQYITMGAVQQLSKKVETLENENKKLKDTISEMNKKINKLMKLIK